MYRFARSAGEVPVSPGSNFTSRYPTPSVVSRIATVKPVQFLLGMNNFNHDGCLRIVIGSGKNLVFWMLKDNFHSFKNYNRQTSSYLVVCIIPCITIKYEYCVGSPGYFPATELLPARKPIFLFRFMMYAGSNNN